MDIDFSGFDLEFENRIVGDDPSALDEYDANKALENSNEHLDDTEWEEIKDNCPKLKLFFDVTIPAANARNEVVETTMFIGCDDWLKECIVNQIRKCIASPVVNYTDPADFNYSESMLTSFISNCQEESLVLLPGNLKKYSLELRDRIQEAINKHTITIIIGKHPTARTITFPMPSVSMLFFSDDALPYTDPLSSIIQNIVDLRFVPKELLFKFQLKKLIINKDFSISEDSLKALAHEAKISHVTPRQILRPVIDYATLNNSTEITLEIINMALNNSGKSNLQFNKVTRLDSMNEFEFERLVYSYFEKSNYNCVKIKDSTEHGISFIAERDDFKIGIQISYSNSQVVIPLVKDIIDDLKSLNLDKGYVVTNRYFSEPVKEMARLNKITLWDRSTIIERFL